MSDPNTPSTSADDTGNDKKTWQQAFEKAKKQFESLASYDGSSLAPLVELPEHQMVIAANIKLLRRLLGLSARELEDLCGLPRNIIGKMESRSAYTKINLQKLILLAAAFGVKPHVLLVADVESRVEGALLTLFETIGQETFPPRTD